MFFSPIWTIFELVRDINKTNALTNFHDNWAKILTSRVFTRKTAPPPGSHVIQMTGTIFELKSHIKETNVLTKFHENWAENVTSRVFTCFHYIHIEKNAPPTGGHVFSPIWTIFELVRDINKTNVLTNFHDNWAKIVTSRVFTRKTAPRQPYKNAPPTGGHVFSPIWTIFELVRDINKTNVLTNFHDDWAKLLLLVFTRTTAPPPPGSHDIQLTGTIFEFNSQIKATNVLTKFHENWAKNVTSRRKMPRPLAAIFFPIWTIFKLVRDINKTNVLTNFHDDWAKIVTFRVFTRKTAPPTGGHVFNGPEPLLNSTNISLRQTF
ncbi:hypothetical protein DPMN_054879 [Dreissena polymorpha]|uniref:Uncharacterized protein n=1 Tax=Dreissena polymorpha TaxID=45954 RepID=A0A9D4CRK9_DREPO|nr:hypothetical protein DPMN_054879 [Dreissena polymorpha]